MAAKLTEEQKALNKEATKLRDKAYRARKGAWNKAMEEVKARIEAGPEAQAAKEADAALDAAMAARNEELAALEARIKALQQEMTERTAAHEVLLEPLREARRKAWNVHRNARTTAENEVRDAYPDVAQCWSAAGWKAIDEFLPLVDKVKE